jgi:hypothetical protein
MTHRWLLPVLAPVLFARPLAAQGGSGTAVTLPPGKYIIEAHDTTKSFSPMPFELKSNGVFVITFAEGTFSGKMKAAKDGSLTYSDQGCLDEKDAQREGAYMVRSERGGYWLDMKSDPCDGRGKSLAEWFFRPAKK